MSVKLETVLAIITCFIGIATFLILFAEFILKLK